MYTALYHCWNDRLLRLSFLCILLMGAAVASITPFQSLIGIERLGFSNGAYAAITTIGAAFSVCASVIAGVYSDQTGRYREVLVGCIIAGILAGACMFIAPSKFNFMLAHIVLLPIASTTFTQYFALASLAASRNPTLDKDFSLSLIRAAFAGTFGLTPPIWAVAVSAGVDLMAVYGFLGVINVAVLVIVMTRWPDPHHTAPQNTVDITFLQALRELGQTRVLSRLVLVSIIVGVNGLYNVLLGLLILNNLGGQEADIGWFAGGVALVEVPVMLLAAIALKRMTKSGLILIGMAIYAAFLAALGTSPTIDVSWILILPGGLGAGILLSVTVGYVQDLVAHRPGAGSSLASVAHFGGTMFAAAMLAGGTVVSDYAGTAWIGSMIGIIAGGLLFLMDGRKMRRH